MKRTLAILLSLAMLLSMTACGAQEEVTTTPAEENSAVEEESETPAEEPEEAPATEEEPVEEDVATPIPQIAYSSGSIEGFTVEGVTLLVDYETVEVTGDSYALLAAAVADWTAEQLADLQESVDYYAEYTPEVYDIDDYECYTLSESIRSTWISESVVSLYFYTYDYLGGTHPYTTRTGVNFDVATGAVLSLSELLDDAEGFYEAAEQEILACLAANYSGGLYADYEECVADFLRGEGNFYLDAEGLHLIFDTYTLGAYALGAIEISLPYAEYGRYLKAEYCGSSGSCVGELSADTTIPWGLSSGEAAVTVSAESGEYGEYTLIVCLDDMRLNLGTYYGSACHACILRRTDGRNFLLVDADYASNDYVTFVIELTEEGPVLCDELEDAALGRINTESVTLEHILYVFGTYSSSMTYELTDSGTLTQCEAFFTIDSDHSDWKTITVVSEIPATIDGAETYLPAGTELVIIGTDNAGTVLFRLKNSGTEGTITYTLGTGDEAYLHYIDGMSEFDCLDGLPYAG